MEIITAHSLYKVANLSAQRPPSSSYLYEHNNFEWSSNHITLCRRLTMDCPMLVDNDIMEITVATLILKPNRLNLILGIYYYSLQKFMKMEIKYHFRCCHRDGDMHINTELKDERKL